MNSSLLDILHVDGKLYLKFRGELTLYNLTNFQSKIDAIDFSKEKIVVIDLMNLSFLDSAAALLLYNLQKKLSLQNIQNYLECDNQDILNILLLVKNQKQKSTKIPQHRRKRIVEKLGEREYKNYLGFLSFMAFMGELFLKKMHYLVSLRNIRLKEIIFEINESGIKAFGIVALTSFLMGLVLAYQSAYQLKIYGANIFIVDMLGISVLRELSPLITAIVIAGRSASAFTAQIGAMKITQELDAMDTMGFDPYKFLVLPKIIALIIIMPILIFISDIMAIIGGMVVANIDLNITTDLFIDRFSEVVAAKQFFIGIAKGPFFAFLIATIGIYRGLMVKDDTQSIGFNTTKSVVESIFAVIVCDALFSIALTNLGI